MRICVNLRKLNDSYFHDPFLTMFSDEVLENVWGKEMYYFTDGFLGYHHITIKNEDQRKTIFSIEWGFYKYIIIPFGLKNAIEIFSRIIVAWFKDFIHKFIEVYFDDWTIFGIVKDHIDSLRMMLEWFFEYQISINLK